MALSGNDQSPSSSPLNPWTAAYEYAVDAWQRGILYADVMRQRGNQYRAHLQEVVPNVLSFPATLVMRGDTRLAWLEGARALDLLLRGPRPQAGRACPTACDDPRGDAPTRPHAKPCCHITRH